MIKELKVIRDNNKDLIIIFSFLERVAGKLVKASVEYKTDKTITFIDYNDLARYFVPVDKVNRILDYCYSEYFFKIILSGSDFYQKVRRVCVDDLDIEPHIFDYFFRSLFFALKNRFECNYKNSPSYTKDRFYRILFHSVSATFDDIPKIDYDYFYDKAILMLKRLEELNFLQYDTNDITGDLRFQSYFAISSHTYKFSLLNNFEYDSSEYDSFSSVFEFLDLRTYINAVEYLNHNLLKKLDKIIHMIILISFDDKEAKYHNNNEHTDNSSIKQFNKHRLSRQSLVLT